ncbi:MAG: YjjG family noncanonical pyrimidine nucleotidase [Chryseolinea sp.]
MSQLSSTPKRKSDAYQNVFFDLDHTLWDYETNSAETLLELYAGYELISKGIASKTEFLDRFRKVNFELWALYDAGAIESSVIREERFKKILTHFSAYDKDLSDNLSSDYLEMCPRKGNLMPHALNVLDYLGARYKLTVITNGFEEIQQIKLMSSNILKYFDHIITSQKAGHRKPSREIFDYALRHNDIQCHQAIMIGDNLIADVGGAKAASIDNVFYNYEKIAHSHSPDFEIGCLRELQLIL